MIRWLKFNAVGIAGAVVQLIALWLLAHVARVQYVVATALAVEIAVLHNFVWHEAWTWRGMPIEGRWQRLFKFHVANGFVSIASNALLTSIFVQQFGLPLLASNVAAMLATALLNFALATIWVFRSARATAYQAPSESERFHEESASR